MNSIQTKYVVGDVVYVATEEKVERRIIEAIKITGVDSDEVQYGWKHSGYFLISPQYLWITEDDLYENKEDAKKHHLNLKVKSEAEAKERQFKAILEEEEDLAEATKRLKEKKRALQKGEPLPEDDEDDY